MKYIVSYFFTTERNPVQLDAIRNRKETERVFVDTYSLFGFIESLADIGIPFTVRTELTSD